MTGVLDQLALLWGFLWDTSVTIPLAQVFLFAALTSVFMLLGWHRIGLVAVLCVVFFWCYVLQMQPVVDTLHDHTWGLLAYGLSGVALVVLIVLGLFTQREG